jgi:D-aminoacyl-tRNA deacylase
MRAVIQRVSRAEVVVDGATVGRIDAGLVILLGVAQGDTAREALQLAEKIVQLRIFEDDAGKMNRSLLDRGGGVLAISQFTLLADCRKGRRPSFTQAATPDEARTLYEQFVAAVQGHQVPVAQGIFQAHMEITLTNDGPVTIVLDTRELARRG